jgi:hypothetical protein
MSDRIQIPENYNLNKYTNSENEIIGLRFISPDEKEEIIILNPTPDYPNGCIRKLRKKIENSLTVIEFYKSDGSWTRDENDINTFFHILTD